MEDVLFSGTTDRKALNLAEVTVTLTELGGALPVEYEEVAITRRLHRSGDSEYLLNGHKVRLKDIHHMLLDTGLGKEAFSILQQGEMDRVIHLPPPERRAIFEEAAGIARFLMRKKEALRKFEKTEANLCRVRDIHAEVKKQWEASIEQAEAAVCYREDKKSLESLEKGVLYTQWFKSEERGSVVKGDLKEKQIKIAALQERKEGFEERFLATKSKRKKLEESLETAQVDYFELKNQKSLEEERKRTNAKRLQETQFRIKALSEEKLTLTGRVSDTNQGLKEKESELKELEEKYNASQKHLRKVREGTEQQEREASSVRQRQIQAQRDHLEWIQKQASTERESGQLKVRMEALDERLTKIKQDQKQVESGFLESKKSVVLAESQEKSVQEQLSQASKKMLVNQSGLENSLKSISELEKELSAVQRQIAEEEAKQKMLLRLKEEGAGTSSGTQTILKASFSVKTFASLLPKNSSASSIYPVAFRQYLQTLVVENQSDLKRVLQHAKEKKISDFSLFCLETISPNCLFSQCGDALEKHFLKNRSSHKEDGSFIDPYGVFFSPGKHTSNPISRELELNQIGKLISKLKVQETKCVEGLDKSRKEKEKQQSDLCLVEAEFKEIERKKIESTFSLRQLRIALEGQKKEIDRFEEETIRCTEEKKQRLEKLQNVVLDNNEAKAQAEKAKQLSVDLEAEVEQKGEDLKGQRKALRELEFSHQSVSEEHQKCLYSHNILEMQQKEGQERLDRVNEEVSRCENVLVELKDFKIDLSNEKPIPTGDLAKKEIVLNEMKESLKSAEDEMDRFDRKLKELYVLSKEVEESQVKLQIEQTKLQAIAEQASHDLFERYELGVQECEPIHLPEGLEISQAEKEVKRLRRSLESMGNVNLAAIDEKGELEERHKFLENQIADLEVSKEELQAMISTLELECRKMFETTFEQIRANFQKNFEILFRGGVADLTYTDGVDILQAGIEIVAKPPGKKMRSISLLSGGEKCLTAMALLFAIFEVRPAPFCVLDEIDAPLDDTNISRFVEVLRQYTDRCQFLIITHNKRTMAIADVLLGVSMERKGVSKLLSLEFDPQTKSGIPALI